MKKHIEHSEFFRISSRLCRLRISSIDITHEIQTGRVLKHLLHVLCCLFRHCYTSEFAFVSFITF